MAQKGAKDGVFGTKAAGFNGPIQRPVDDDQRTAWQRANRAWWTSAPMRYDWQADIPFPEHSRDYFAEIDARFLATVREFMPWQRLPFDNQIPYDALPSLDVLEIGTGFGTHASLIAPHARFYTGLDLTEPAVEATRTRMEQMGLTTAKVLQMDAEEMTFPAGSFDYVWSWGVIHHSADPRRILEQMHRVLRPGGRANVMIYHRSFWKYYVFDGILKGLVQGLLFRRRSILGVNQAQADGAIARFYRPKEWEALCGDLFRIETMEVAGLKSDVLPLPPGRIKDAVTRLLPDSVARFFTNRLRWGYFLMVGMTKR
ncbi:MAG: class I SAM-dependent methyltransferase [Albidovulum sp.]